MLTCCSLSYRSLANYLPPFLLISDSLKSFATQNTTNLPAQNMQQDNTANQFMTVTGLPPTDHPSTSMNKIPGMHHEITNTHPPQQTSAIALSNYQNMLKNSMGVNRNALSHEISSVFNMSQNGMTGMTGMPGTSLAGLMQQPSQVNQQHLQQHVIQQLLQEVKNNSRPVPLPTPHLVGQQSVQCATNMSASTGPTGMTGPNAHMMNRSSSFKSVGSNPNAGASTSNLTTPKPEVVTQPMDLPELDQIGDFTDNGLFDSADAGYGWKMWWLLMIYFCVFWLLCGKRSVYCSSILYSYDEEMPVSSVDCWSFQHIIVGSVLRCFL